jgi:hypothetical protein
MFVDNLSIQWNFKSFKKTVLSTIAYILFFLDPVLLIAVFLLADISDNNIIINQ